MGLDLDDAAEHRFEHAAGGYGVEVCGGTAGERERVLQERLDTPQVAVDCRGVTEAADVVRAVLSEGPYPDERIDQLHRPSSRELESTLSDMGASLLLLEFDAMPSDTQTTVAQMMKGLCERRGFDQMVGYTSSEGGAVVRAEGDLSMRVQSFDLGD